MARVEAEEVEKKKKEREKEERKRKREEKKNKPKKKGKYDRVPVDQPLAQRQSRYMCIECEMYYDNEEEWIECESCGNWYHLSCAGMEALMEEELREATFTCSSCS